MSTATKLFLTALSAVALLHAASLDGEFVWDDYEMIVANTTLDDLANIPSFFRQNYFGDRANSELFRPLVNTSLAVDRHLFGRTPTGFRLANILYHLASGILLWLLLRRLTDRRDLPTAAAILFLVHPASAEPVGWIVGRGDSIALVLALLCLHLHLSGRNRPWVHGAALLTYLLALFGKLSAAPVPLLALLMECTFRRLALRDLLRRENFLRYAAYLVPLLMYVVVRDAAMDGLVPRGPGLAWKDVDVLAALFVAPALVFRHLANFLLPAGLCGDYSAAPFWTGEGLTAAATRPGVPLLAGGLLFVIVVVVAARRRHQWLFFGTMWMLVGLLPVSQVVRIGAVTADRFLYLPAAGGAAALAALLLALPRGRYVAFAVVALCFSALTVSREAVWKSDLSLARDVLRAGNYPDDEHAWNRMGLWHHRRKEYAEADAAYREGLARRPKSSQLGKNLGALLLEQGRLPEAREYLRAGLESARPGTLTWAKIAYNLSLAHLAEGEHETAERLLLAASRCRPPLPTAFLRLARLYEEDLERPERGAELRRELRKLSR